MADYDYDDSGSEVDFESGKKERASTKGRKLMRWNPDVDQYVLLAVEIVCSETGNPVPWDAVADKINDYTTGEGIKQHLAKLRKYREQNGRPVPYRSRGWQTSTYDKKAANASRRTSKKQNSGDDSYEVDGLAIGKGAGLLWTNPKALQKKPNAPVEMKEQKREEPKPKQTKKSTSNTTTTLATPKAVIKQSRKPATKAEHSESVPAKKKATGKRSRPKKEPSIKSEEDDDDYFDSESPSKKQRNLRPTYHVNYDESQTFGEDDEDVFDAGSKKTGSEASAVHFYEPQVGVMTSSNGPSHSRRDSGVSLMPPPSFDTPPHSDTGVNPYGEGHDDSGMFAGLNNGYAPAGFQEAPNMRHDRDYLDNTEQPQLASDYDFNGNYGQMVPENEDPFAFGDYAGNQQGRGHHGDQAAPAPKARKQTNRRTSKHEESESISRHSEKKYSTKTKKQGAVKGGNKHEDRKPRNTNALQDYNPPEQQVPYPSKEHAYGDIPIVNDTGRGIINTSFSDGNHTNFAGNNDTNLGLPPNPYDLQQAPSLTASPTNFQNHGLQHGLSATTPSSYNNFNGTGITPNFNNFTFPPNVNSFNNNTDANFLLSSTGYGGDRFNNHNEFNNFNDNNVNDHNVNEFDDGMNSLTSVDNSFSSSYQTPAAGSQSSESMLGGGAGLGLHSDAHLPQMGMGMDMSGDGQQDDDVFCFIDPNSYGFH